MLPSRVIQPSWRCSAKRTASVLLGCPTSRQAEPSESMRARSAMPLSLPRRPTIASADARRAGRFASSEKSRRSGGDGAAAGAVDGVVAAVVPRSGGGSPLLALVNVSSGVSTFLLDAPEAVSILASPADGGHAAVDVLSGKPAASLGALAGDGAVAMTLQPYQTAWVVTAEAAVAAAANL